MEIFLLTLIILIGYFFISLSNNKRSQKEKLQTLQRLKQEQDQRRIEEDERKKEARRKLFEDTLKREVPIALKFLQEIELQKKEYFTDMAKQKIITDYKRFNESCIKDSSDGTLNQFIQVYSHLDKLIVKWNKEYVQRELKQNDSFFSNIDGKSLDDQQRTAVVIDESNNLILAGAGSGKTLTIAGKVKYLVEQKKVSPDEILLVTYTKKAATEMEERITNKMNIPIESMTFHKLGLRMITQKREQFPNVSNQLNKIILDYFENEILSNSLLMNKVIYFFSYYINIPPEYEKYENLGDMYSHLKSTNLETIKSKFEKDIKALKQDRFTIAGEEVKSIEEVIIANFLYLNGIEYEYEKIYPYPSPDPYRKRYQPDFYLPEYDIYIEHFGISENNQTPWLSPIEEKKYLEGMKWKREFHATNQTTLLETYSYFNKNGVLLYKLESLLKKNGVNIRPRNLQDIYKQIYITQKEKDRDFGEIVKLIQTFIGLFKSKGNTADDFKVIQSEILKNEAHLFIKDRNLLLLSIIESVFTYYEAELKIAEAIDFADMINEATVLIEQNQVSYPKYKYIIVDEYQDISFDRFKLIRALKDQTQAKIMCVGDDWQSIYRFAGSDLQLFIDFERFFGFTQQLKIEKTYRNSQALVKTAGNFVMKNKNQIKKRLTSPKSLEQPVVIYGFNKDFSLAFEKALQDILIHHGENSTVLILGRNNYDLNRIEQLGNHLFTIRQKETKTIIQYQKHPKMVIEFLTVHRSKGLEADNVIVINVENKTSGFPNKISDDSILSYVLTDSDDFPFAEERRLFYVAITRTRNKTYLIAPQQDSSIFVEELVKELRIPFQVVTNEESIREYPKCSHCKTGTLIIRENKTSNQNFLGCTNFPNCSQSFKDLTLIQDQVICPDCKGYMIKRNSKEGAFYGCSNYPHCKIIIDIQSISNTNLNKPVLLDPLKESESTVVSQPSNSQMKTKDSTTVIKTPLTPYEMGETLNIQFIPTLINCLTNDKESRLAVSAIGKIASANPGKCNIAIEPLINCFYSKGLQTWQSTCKSLQYFKLNDAQINEILAVLSLEKTPSIIRAMESLMLVQNNTITNVKHIERDISKAKSKNVTTKKSSSKIIEQKEEYSKTALGELKLKSDQFFNQNINNKETLDINYKLIQSGNSHIKYFRRLAKAYSKLNRIDDAITIYKKILKVIPNDNEAVDFMEIYSKGYYQKYSNKVYGGTYRDVFSPPPEEILKYLGEKNPMDIFKK